MQVTAVEQITIISSIKQISHHTLKQQMKNKVNFVFIKLKLINFKKLNFNFK